MMAKPSVSFLMKIGGSWISAARSWIQWRKVNGSDVTWGSQQELRPTMTVKDVEEVSAEVAATVLTECGFVGKEFSPETRWDALRTAILKEIEKIDKDTPWQEFEPKWWLHMTSVRRALEERS